MKNSGVDSPILRIRFEVASVPALEPACAGFRLNEVSGIVSSRCHLSLTFQVTLKPVAICGSIEVGFA